MDRLIAFLYGLACYVIFFSTMLYAVGFVSGLGVPKTIDTGATVPTVEASAVDLLLICVFAIQHSVMARRYFKQWWTKFVPAAVERSTYVLFSSLALAFLFWQWRPIPAQLWQIADPQIAAAVTGLSVFGWMIARASTFLVNHFELFGLHQVAANLIGREAPTRRFHAPVFYKLVRHPTYLGLIIAFWVAPTMTVGHLLFAVATTAYIFVGISFEERDLVDLFGERYRSYRARVAMLVPRSRPE
jgi:protein-S-isoprenylcysteine O-methyltransferase Ste14